MDKKNQVFFINIIFKNLNYLSDYQYLILFEPTLFIYPLLFNRLIILSIDVFSRLQVFDNSCLVIFGLFLISERTFIWEWLRDLSLASLIKLKGIVIIISLVEHIYNFCYRKYYLVKNFIY